MATQQQDPILPLDIDNVSSEDPQYLAASVLQGNALSQGWRSVMNSQMPQQITVRLQQGLCNISSIQFVSHETYVPAMVEVYTSASVPAREWVRLGHVRMGENQNIKARERKTFRFRIKAQLVKFVFNQLLGNPENQTGQVSIAAVVIRGEIAPQEQQQIQNISPVRQIVAPQASGIKNPYIQKADQLKTELQVLKTECLQKDKFLEANRYKTAYAKLTDLQNALEQLELKKNAAINREDYVVAHTMKESVEQIQKLIDIPLQELICILNGEEVKKPEIKPVQYAQQQQIVQAQQVIQQVVENGNQNEQQQQEQQQEQPQEIIGNDLSAVVPKIRQEDPMAHPDQRAINTGNGYGFQLSEEEKQQYEKEQKERALAMLKKKEKELKIKNGENVEDDEKDNKQNVKNKQSEHSDQYTPKFNANNFNFQREMDVLCTAWSKDQAAPPNLSAEHDRTPEASILRASNFQDIYVRLCCSKNVEHVQDSVLFMICCLKQDYIKYSESAISLINLLGMNINQALFGFANQLVCYTYLSLLIKYSPQIQQIAKIDFEFFNIDDQLVNQKDGAIIYADMTVFFIQQPIDVEKAIMTSMGKQYTAFQSEVLQLLQTMMSRLTAQQKRVRQITLNMLTTLASFICFPVQQFTTSLVKKQNIDRMSQLKANEQILTNNKYFSIIEARASALSSILKLNYNLVGQIIPQLLELIKWVFPNATKAEFKKSMIDIVVLIYETDACVELIQLLNGCIKNSALFKQLQLKCQESDEERQGSCRVKYVDQDGGRLIMEDQLQQTTVQPDFEQGTCQFCLWKSPKPESADFMWEHLMKKCPCCCVCPACHLVVEVPMLPEHMVNECEARNNYQFKLKQCSKCSTVVEEKGLQEHQLNCAVKLQPDQSVCPLCNELLKDTEEALDHYAENKCNANPRTTEKLKQIVQQKVSTEK